MLGQIIWYRKVKNLNFSKEDTNKLVEKIKKGEKLDSEKKNEKPIKEYEYLEGVNRNRVEKFKDGSYIVTSWPDEEELMKKIETRSREDKVAKVETDGVVVSKDSQHTSFEGGKVVKNYGLRSASLRLTTPHLEVI
ncbi:MAG: hypothetical protein Q4B52_05325 [Tissierellia bacterium]|nr:hypothetical protein [Tissierellia bacterium]